MKIIHYNSDETKFRFIKRTDTNYFREVFNNATDETYQQQNDIKEFLKVLVERLNFSDVLLLTSHGSNDALLNVRKGKLVRAMKKSQTHLFKHNFIMAIACNTANEFGIEAVNQKAQTYIGFNDNIQCDFEFDTTKNGKINDMLEIIYKKVFQDSFNSSFMEFIKECKTSKEFVQIWDLAFKKSVIRVTKLKIDEIRKEFSVPLTMKYEKELKVIIKLEFIAKYNTFSSKLVLLGDPNFIAWYYIGQQSDVELRALLRKTERILIENNYYKYFIQSIIYRALNDHEGFNNSFIELEKCLSDSSLLFDLPDGFYKIAE